MNHHKPKTAKIPSGLNLGLYHHVLNSCCPYKAIPVKLIMVIMFGTYLQQPN